MKIPIFPIRKRPIFPIRKTPIFPICKIQIVPIWPSSNVTKLAKIVKIQLDQKIVSRKLLGIVKCFEEKKRRYFEIVDFVLFRINIFS